MLSDEMQEALNRQINTEFVAAYKYLALSAFFEQMNMKGCAHWMRVQYDEERAHALKIYDYVHDRDGEVVLHPVEAPDGGWTTPLEAFEAALAAERYNSGQIGRLVELAAAQSDHATHAFLQWFVNEQVEEEASTKQIVDKLAFVGDNRTGQFIIDQELGQRAPSPEIQGVDA